jgi:hypothetical protein
MLIANLYVIYSEMIAGRHFSFAWLFYFDSRLNFPFFFSLFLHVINLLLLYNIARGKEWPRSQALFWNAMFVTFLLFALDEAFYIHQHFKMSTFGVIASYDRASWSHYLWVLPYFVVFGTLMVILFRYSAEINQKLKKRLLTAAFVFLLGAVVMEFMGTYYAVLNPHGDIYLLLIKTAEGTLQMIGSIMFIDALLQEPGFSQRTRI